MGFEICKFDAVGDEGCACSRCQLWARTHTPEYLAKFASPTVNDVELPRKASAASRTVPMFAEARKPEQLGFNFAGGK